MHGTGVIKYTDGSFYDGEWKDSMILGKGIFNYTDGNVYDGEWKESKKHGKVC